MRTGRRWTTRAALIVVVLSGVAVLPGAAWAAGTPTAERAYELVSPPDKRGGDIVADSRRTRAADDGNALGFISLTAFGDAVGTGVATDYVSVRSTSASPGSNGWATHAISPRQSANTLTGIFSRTEPYYVGEFSPDLQRGVYFASSSLTADPFVARALNLYRRSDLRTPGAGTYALVTGCPLCELLTTPLPPLPGDTGAFLLRPLLGGASPDLEHVIFESTQRLTIDTPALDAARLYEWEAGEVRLVGRIPSGSALMCDDIGGPACVPFGASVAGQGATTDFVAPHTVSDGSDGHRRVFFTGPTDSGGSVDPAATAGNVFMRVDGTVTVRLNESERSSRPHDAFAPAQYWDAAVDGSRALLTTSQALTDDAPVGGQVKLYMYDTTKPPSAPDNLTLINGDEEFGDNFGAFGVIGIGGDEDPYIYFVDNGQLVVGQPLLTGSEAQGVFVWHDGDLGYVGPVEFGSSWELFSTGINFLLFPRQARVTPDGRRLLFSAYDGSGLLGYDHGSCGGGRCRQLYVYDAPTEQLSCASCNPSGEAGTTHASSFVSEFNSGTQPDKHETRALTVDGSRVFFSTGEALVPEDVNNRIDAYEYDVDAGTARLLSSGKSTSHSWFLDASSDGDDAFFITRERLVGWDRDGQYDVYDARGGGGFPEPAPTTPGCSGDACQGATAAPPQVAAGGSAVFAGAGNASEKLKPRAKGKTRCKRGFVKKRVGGKRGKRVRGKGRVKAKRRCVRAKRGARGHKQRAARARAERSGS